MRQGIMTKMNVNLDTLVENYREVCRYTSPARVFAVVKSEAYGHGALPVARALQGAGCESFAVAMVDEGIQLRRAGLAGEIMVMGATLPEQMPALAEHDLIPVIPDVERLRAWADTAKAQRRRLSYHLKVDVGLGRMGFLPAAGAQAARAAAGLGDIELVGIGSHLSYPGGSLAINEQELARYQVFVAPFLPHFPHLLRHLAASQAVARFPDMHMDLVRVGGLLYGLQHVTHAPLKLRPVMEFRTVVAQVRDLPRGWHVGYDQARVLEKPTRVALLPLGWTDGLATSQLDRARVLINGAFCRLIGLCTDFAMVDVTHLPRVGTGDAVVLIGEQQGRSLTAIELGEAGGISTGQLLGKISLRVPRIYTQEGREREELSILNYS